MDDLQEQAARDAWTEELAVRERRLREAGQRDLERLQRLLTTLGIEPEPTTLEYLEDGTVRQQLCTSQPARTFPDRPAAPARPGVWAEARQGDIRLRANVLKGSGGVQLGSPADAGSFDTLADLGRALEEGGQPPPEEAEEGTVELLARVLRALVDDAVDARLAGEL